MGEETALSKVLSIMGGQSALAEKLKIKPQSVQGWVVSGKVPVKRVLAVEEAVGGQVTRYELRPDIYGEAPPEDQKNAA